MSSFESSLYFCITSLVKGTFNFKKRSSRRSLQSLQLVHSNLNSLQSLQSLQFK
jgi:hypothetical protein